MRKYSDLPYLEWEEPKTGEVKRMYPDTCTAEQIGLPAVVTEHAVETGSKITDHYRKDNETSIVKMFFSTVPIRGDLDPDNPGEIKHFDFSLPDYPPGAPIYTPGGLTAAAKAALGSLFGGGDPKPTGYEALAFSSDPGDRIKLVLDLIRRFQTEGILCVFNTNLGRLENMGITLATGDSEQDGGDGAYLELNARQVRFVSSDIALAAPLPAEPRGQKKGSGNNASGANTLSGSQSSIAKAAFNKFGIHL